MTIGKNMGKEIHMTSAVSAADIAPTAYAWEIQATGLKVRVGRKRMAVDGLDLSLGVGVHGLLGPNGAGKTTLIRTLATVLRPTEGRLELLGESVGGMSQHRGVRRRIGYLPQEFGYYKRFTVREFVEYMAWLKEVPKASIPAAVQRAVERVGLADRADERMKALSGGMVRRVGIAQAIVNDPTILLLDEPTVGLDVLASRFLRDFVRTERSRGKAILFSTHYLAEAELLCDRVGLMHRGRLLAEGPPPELRERAGGAASLEEAFLRLVEEAEPAEASSDGPPSPVVSA
jgi:ABC-2 type transport system ATP-binding protein